MTTLNEIKAQIRDLQRLEKEIIQQEKVAVIENIKKMIFDYDITAKELGFYDVHTEKKTPTSAKGTPKYRNEHGETWSGGRGPKPKWVKSILESGGNMEDYLI